MPEKKQRAFRFNFTEFLLVLLLVVSGVTLAFSGGGFVLSFKRLGFSVISALDRGVHSVMGGISGTFSAVKELKELRDEYNQLVVKLEHYEEMQRSNSDIRKENERLREQLGFSSSLDEKNIPAQIISRNLDDIYSYLTIDKGSVNGIKKNMPVVAFQNGNQGLVGKIVQVGTFTSQVMPIYHIENMVSARIQNTRDLGLVSGLGSQNQPLLMQYIRKRVAEELSYGDIIVTSGENNNYMRDIPIGTITKITVLDYNSALNIELMPVIDFSRLETVIVVNQNELNDRKAGGAEE